MAGMMTVTKKDRLQEGQRPSGSVTPPDGGWGWMVVIGCFLATICIRAVTRCVSMFFLEFQMHFEKDYSTTAWIHSLIDSTTMLCAPLGSFLGHRLSCRATVMLGGLLSCTGLILSSFASSLEYLYMSMGVLTGLGFALSYTPAIAMVGRYFNERKALAFGIAMSGSGIGTFLLAPAVQLTIEHYSWRGALLILGGFVSNLLVCGALMRPLEARGGKRTLDSNITNSEHKMTILDSKVSTHCSQVELKQLGLKETQGLLLANGTFKNLGNNILGQGNITLLPNPSLSDRQSRIAECILFSNKLTETMLGEIDFSDQLSNSSMTEDLKMVESMKSNNEETHIFPQMDDLKFCEATSTDKTISPSQQTLVNTQTKSGGNFFCFESSKEFGFLLSPNFLILSVSFLFLAYGCSAPVVYLVPYALSVGVEHQQAAFLMSIFGVSGIVGNISFGWITDRQCLKKYRMLSYAVAISLEGLCCMSVPFLRSFSLLVPFCALYGYFDGAYVALIPVVTSDTVGSDYLTSALGVVYFLHAIPYLISPPIGGWLVDQTGNYAATFFLSSASFIFSSLILAAMILVRHSKKSKSKAARLDPSDTDAAQQDII